MITELAKRKTQAVLLACTELVFAVDVRANVIPVYDTTALHSRAAVDWMLADEEEARAAACPLALLSASAYLGSVSKADRPDHPKSAERFNEEQATYAV